MTDLVGGRVNVTMNSIAPVLSHIKAGRLQALGVASLKRSALLPNVPTIDEAGVPKFESSSWLGLLAPAKTPAPILARLCETVSKAVQSPEGTSRLEAQGAEVGAGTPAEFAALIKRDPRAQCEDHQDRRRQSGLNVIRFITPVPGVTFRFAAREDVPVQLLTLIRELASSNV